MSASKDSGKPLADIRRRFQAEVGAHLHAIHGFGIRYDESNNPYLQLWVDEGSDLVLPRSYEGLDVVILESPRDKWLENKEAP